MNHKATAMDSFVITRILISIAPRNILTFSYGTNGRLPCSIGAAQTTNSVGNPSNYWTSSRSFLILFLVSLYGSKFLFSCIFCKCIASIYGYSAQLFCYFFTYLYRFQTCLCNNSRWVIDFNYNNAIFLPICFPIFCNSLGCILYLNSS